MQAKVFCNKTNAKSLTEQKKVRGSVEKSNLICPIATCYLVFTTKFIMKKGVDIRQNILKNKIIILLLIY